MLSEETTSFSGTVGKACRPWVPNQNRATRNTTCLRTWDSLDATQRSAEWIAFEIDRSHRFYTKFRSHRLLQREHHVRVRFTQSQPVLIVVRNVHQQRLEHQHFHRITVQVSKILEQPRISVQLNIRTSCLIFQQILKGIVLSRSFRGTRFQARFVGPAESIVGCLEGRIPRQTLKIVVHDDDAINVVPSPQLSEYLLPQRGGCFPREDDQVLVSHFPQVRLPVNKHVEVGQVANDEDPGLDRILVDVFEQKFDKARLKLRQNYGEREWTKLGGSSNEVQQLSQIVTLSTG